MLISDVMTHFRNREWPFESTNSFLLDHELDNTVLRTHEESDSTTMPSYNSSLYLSQHDELYVKIYLPTILFLSILMLLGLVGNGVVCFIYLVKFKTCTTRCFIITMGVLDLLNCAISIPVQILELRYSTRFGGFGLCQVLVMCVTFFSMSSAAVLLAVAVDRYRKICRHFLKQMTPHAAKVICVVCCVLTGLFATPTIVIYGPGTVRLQHVNATICLTADDNSHFIYTAIQTVIFLVASVTLIVLYALIWRQVRLQQVVRKRLSQSQSSDRSKLTINCNRGDTEVSSAHTASTVCSCFSSSGSSNCKETPTIVYLKEDEDGAVNIHTKQRSYTTRHSKQNTTEGPSESSQNSVFDRYSAQGKSRFSSGIANREKDNFTGKKQTLTRKNGSRKITFMLFLISVVFIVSYLPYLAIKVADAVDDTYRDNIQALAAIFERSYFVQSVSNPIIYSFCNENFRYQVKRVFLRKTV